MGKIRSFLSDVWRLARPYFFSDEKWIARGLLASVIALNLILVGMTVVLNFWHREIYNALQDKNWDAFIQLLFTYRYTDSGWMPGFCGLVVVYIVFAVYRTYLQQWLQIRWRNWLTARFVGSWLSDRAYYRLSLGGAPDGVTVDNPDQRIAEDVRDFVDNTLSLSLSLMNHVVTLFSFLGILWGLSGAVAVFGIHIPGYMVWTALLYSIIGTWLTHKIGWPLIGLNFKQQVVEADFRYAAVRVRENVEGIALFGGEAEERQNLGQRFRAIMANWWLLMSRIKFINAFIAGYDQIASIFPLVVASPGYFAGTLTLGALMQTLSAFARVQGALSWFINAYSGNNPSDVSLARWRSIVMRLTSFEAALAGARAPSGIGLAPAGPLEGVVAEDLTLTLPDGRTLLAGADFVFPPGESVVVTGRSGSGKSTLFRALAGIWPFGRGRIRRPAGRVMFLPQRPYIPLGTLRRVIAYPAGAESLSPAAAANALEAAGLGQLIPELDEDLNWPQRLSGGEQQRVALARALVAQPDWLFLDEATASLDPDAERELQQILRERLPQTTIVSISHRPGPADGHDRRLVFVREEAGPGRLQEATPVEA